MEGIEVIRLFSQFASHMWAQEQLIYKKKIMFFCFFLSFTQWEPVPYFNNKIICDLVEEKFRGIISLLVKKRHHIKYCADEPKHAIIPAVLS